MVQDGSDDGIQDRANCIQFDLEELVRALSERCKTYGLRAKPISLVELPYGWQLGIQDGAADLDEDWDKFEDEGFTFVKELTLDVQNLVAPPKPKSLLVQNKASSRDEDETAVLSSSADNKSEKLPRVGERIAYDYLVNARDEEGVASDSPVKRNGLESPFKKIQDSPSRKNISGDDSSHAIETESEQRGC